MSTIIESIERRQLRQVPRFDPGDRVRVHFQVVEGERRRTQVFEGIVIKRQGSAARETFTVRKQSFGVGVERTFPVHSPKIERLEVAARGDVRRAKLYYLRDRVGKAARVAERRWGGDDLVTRAADEGALDSEGKAEADLDTEAVEGQGDTEAVESEGDAEAVEGQGDAEAVEGEGDAEAAAEPEPVEDVPEAGVEEAAGAAGTGDDSPADAGGEAGTEDAADR